jgi:hypothetical protein
MERYRQVEDTAVTVIEGEAAIVTLPESRLHLLNGVATRIWELCADDGATLPELVASLCEEFEVSQNTAETECHSFLETAVNTGILRVE